MWQSKPQGHHNVVGSAVAAAFASVLMRKVATRPSEIMSELTCWIALLLLFKITNISGRSATSGSSVLSVGDRRPQAGFVGSIFAVGIAVASFCKAENSVLGFTPALTPLLFIIQRQFQPDFQRSQATRRRYIEALASTLWGNVLVAAFSIYVLSNWSLLGFAASIGALAGSTMAYCTLLQRGVKDDSPIPPLSLERDISTVAPRTITALIVALGIQTAMFGFTSGNTLLAMLLGVTKALSWYFTIRAAQHTSWCISPAIETFSNFAARDPYAQALEIDAIFCLFGAFLTLAQISQFIPRSGGNKRLLWALGALPLLPFIANHFANFRAYSLAPKYDATTVHPVARLIEHATIEFNSLLGRQSKTLSEAESAYRQRYKMEPPPGFNKWYEFAVAQQSPLIDDFDTIYHSVAPLWRLSGVEVRQAMRSVQTHRDAEVWLCEFTSKTGKTSCSHPRRSFDRHTSLLFEQLLGDIVGDIPDVQFLVNHLDEPRVLFPMESDGSDPPTLDLLSHSSTWERLTQFCPLATKASATDHVQTFGIPFVTDPNGMADLCQHPNYRMMHGMFQSPTSFRLVQGFVPILSTGSPSTMHDILYPSAAYIESEFQYDSSHDIPWHKKRNNMYWAGSTSGAFSKDGQWKQYHRQRFVELAQNLQHGQYAYLRSIGGEMKRVMSSFWNGRLYDVTFTRVFQCQSRDCRQQRAYFNMRAWADKDEALHSKLAFDLDGNGISGRYYKLLSSNSVPLKQTLLREWHDDRHMAWVHYVPVSQTMEELPELVYYLTSTNQGQRVAQQVAETGRDWFSQAFRQADMAVYVYRLLLELARLQDPERQAS